MSANTQKNYLLFAPNDLFAKQFVRPLLEIPALQNVQTSLFLNHSSDAKSIVRHTLSLNPITLITRLAQLLKLMHERPVCVHAHTTTGALLPLAAARLRGVPKRIYHNHGSAIAGYRWPLGMLFGLLERINCGLASHVITVNPWLRETFIKKGIVAADKCQVAGAGSAVGVNLETFYPPSPKQRQTARERLEIPEKNFVVLYVGRPHHRKGFFLMLKAWRLFLTSDDQDWLLIAGCQQSDLPARFRKKELNCKALGIQQNMTALYHAADLVCLPSAFEGFGQTLLEGAACGLPLLTTDIPGTQLIVRDEIEGRRIPPKDISCLADMLQRLKNSPDLCRRYGENACQRAAVFARGEICSALNEILAALLKENNSN